MVLTSHVLYLQVAELSVTKYLTYAHILSATTLKSRLQLIHECHPHSKNKSLSICSLNKTLFRLQTRHTKDRHMQAGAAGFSCEGAAQLKGQVCVNSPCACACQSSRWTLKGASP